MSLEKGLMVGVIPVSLSDLGSGVNNFSDVTTVPTEQNDLDLIALLGPPEYPLSSIDELVNSFGFDYSEIRYMAQIVFAPYIYLRNQIDNVMQRIRQWYNGYQLYRFSGKYNPWSVCFCLKHLVQRISGKEGYSGESVSKLVNLSTKNYWDRTGSPGLIQRQMELHPDEFCELANILFKEFAEHSNRDPFADIPSEAAIELPWSDFRLSDLATEDFNQSAFLNLALYSGYLTVRSSATVGIPNGELQRVWDAILRQMLLHSVSSNRSLLKKGKLLTELHNGKTDYLCQLIKGSCAILANHKSHKEFEYANIAVATINCAASFGVFTHPSQTDCCPFDYTINRESAAGQGNIDWVTLLHSTKNERNAFGMLVEFKHIPDDTVKSNRVGYGKAKKGLQQIKDKYYSLSMDRCVECIHIGISIGRGAVHAVSQLYMRDSTEEEWIETDSLV
ncbi:hypothetical protein IWW48_006059 [Coemansia sp. RSA 1200]|nr:hypothetical protein IWW48_006059 [Coemansia sp. RSA 1200]